MKTEDFLIASVAVEGTVYHFDKAFDYAVPSELSEQVAAGCRVSVPFAKGNRQRQGIIMSLGRGEAEGLKCINSVLDKEPVLSEKMLSLAEFMSRNYYCTLFEAVKAMLPAGINYNITTTYALAEGVPLEGLSEDDRRICDYLKKTAKPVKREQLMSLFALADFAPLEELAGKGVLVKADDAFRRVGDKSQRMVRLTSEGIDFDGKLSEKQRSVAELIRDAGEASVKEICYYTGVTQSVVDAVVKKGIAEYFDCEVLRKPQTSVNEQIDFPKLNSEQSLAFSGIREKLLEEKASVSLLYGVTGSGKTAVFMNLIKEAVDRNKDVIVMVPEIALTPQLVSKFKGLFGDDVAVFHSGLSLGERLDEFKRVQRGIAKIAVGTRSAVFAPCKNLGLIIMDEEQEHTYKSENKPRFHARDVAKFRCANENAVLLLSSATPDVETYYYAKSGRYSLFELPSRYGKAQLPEVLTVDMNEETEAGNNTGLSSALLTAVEENLKNKTQSILLLNRRGYNTFATCRKCKEPVTCPNCSISLTYHSVNNRLMCHYCGYSEAMT
ncbi:MAG: primosomal protein N', partial [Ruminococcus sp.]